MEFSITNTIDEAKWRGFIDQHPQANIFHTPEMYQVFARARGYRPELYAAVGPDGAVNALLLPVEVRVRDGLPRRLTARSIAYGSVLCSHGAPGQEALSALLEHYVRKAGRQCLFTELRHLSDMSAYQSILTKHHFTYNEQLDYLIDTGCSSDEVFKRFGRHTRRHIRHAAKVGAVTVEEINRRSQISEIYEQLKKSYAAARVPLADISLFEAAFDVLHPCGMVKFWLARVEGTPVASSIELLYQNTVYGWYGGVDRSFSSYTPNELLTWEVLKWAAENGYQTYDFGGAGLPGEEYGVRDFKAKFGGRLVSYGRHVFVPDPMLLRVSQLGYGFFRRFLAR